MTQAVEFREPTEADIEAVARTMRRADVTEVRLSNHHTPRQALDFSLSMSDWAQAACVDGKPFVIFGVGVSSLLASTGSPWALANDDFYAHRRIFAAYSRPIITHMRRGYATLENWVWAGNVVSRRWLWSCGFTIEPEAPYGPEGALFNRFHMDGI